MHLRRDASSWLTCWAGRVSPKGALARVLAVSIGGVGILFTGLVAAIGVQALNATLHIQRPR